jgi:hypothetical protein
VKKWLTGTTLLSLAVAPGFAAALFQVNFSTDHQGAVFNIMVNAAEATTIETYSYAGRRVHAARRRRVDHAASAAPQFPFTISFDEG